MLKVTWEYAIQPENLEGLALPIAYGGEHVAQPCYLTKAEESEDWRGFLARMEQERCQYCQRYRGHGAVCGRCWRM